MASDLQPLVGNQRGNQSPVAKQALPSANELGVRNLQRPSNQVKTAADEQRSRSTSKKNRSGGSNQKLLGATSRNGPGESSAPILVLPNDTKKGDKGKVKPFAGSYQKSLTITTGPTGLKSTGPTGLESSIVSSAEQSS